MAYSKADSSVEREFYTIGNAAKKLDVSPYLIRRLIHTGELKASRIGGRYIIHRDALAAAIVEVEPKEAYLPQEVETEVENYG